MVGYPLTNLIYLSMWLTLIKILSEHELLTLLVIDN
jgi:hypothetical protein